MSKALSSPFDATHEEILPETICVIFRFEGLFSGQIVSRGLKSNDLLLTALQASCTRKKPSIFELILALGTQQAMIVVQTGRHNGQAPSRNNAPRTVPPPKI